LREIYKQLLFFSVGHFCYVSISRCTFAPIINITMHFDIEV